MPLFAFANAGLPISAAELRDPVATAVFFGLTLGKPLGVITFSWLAVRSGIAVRPPSLDWGMLAGGGMLAGIGFTMALFIAGLAFGDDHLNAAKLGILSASVVSAVLGTALLLLAPLTRSAGLHVTWPPERCFLGVTVPGPRVIGDAESTDTVRTLN